MSTTTPGQAAYERSRIAPPAGIPHTPWNELPVEIREFWNDAAQAAIDAFLAGDSVSAESIREALAAREPQPAPGELALATQALREIAMGTVNAGPLDPSVHADKALTAMKAARAAQPAPELAAAPMPRVDWARASEAVADRERERDEARAERDALREDIKRLRGELESSAAMTHPSRKSDVERRVIAALSAVLSGKPGSYL